jgi:hypothetical protein
VLHGGTANKKRKMNTKNVLNCFLLLLMTGCGSSKLDGLVPASGTVTFNGSPVEQATIIFSPKSGETQARAASATTDSHGKFSMMTLYPGDGVFPGNYAVTIEKVETTGEVRYIEEKKEAVDDRQIIDLLPVKYNNTNTSDLSVSILARGDKAIELNLSGEVDSKPKRPNDRVRR